MVEISNAEASANILRFAEEGRIVQGLWHGRQGHDGREIACLLGAIHPSVTSAEECNGKLMPMWLAKLTPLLFDSIQAVEIVAVARRYGELVARWGGLAPEAWERVKTAFLIRTVDEAMEAARPVSKRKPYWPAVEAACNNTKSALESGDKKALKAARAARAVEAAVWAVEAVEGAAAARAVWTAEEAAGAAEAEGAETEAVAVWTAAAEGAGAAVQAETEAVFCLRLFTFILDRIEAECP